MQYYPPLPLSVVSGMISVTQAPYTPDSSPFNALPELRVDDDVAALRDLHEADLVQLVGALSGSCGRG